MEKYYSNGIYPYISAAQRIVFGWIPFSIGDIFYIFAGAWLLYSIIIFIRRLVQKRADKSYLKNTALNFFTIALAVYVAFNLLWGLNYNRRGIDYQLKLDNLKYENKDLARVTELIAERMNQLQASSLKTRKKLRRKRYLFNGAADAYSNLMRSTGIQYNHPSIKPSIFSYLGNYLGFTGYYNPFTGEAQVNTTIPLFTRPFTTCHEVGHQLGYAKESEANFAGYLSAISSGDSAFLYSVYFEMFAYAGRYLYYADSIHLKEIKKRLSPGVNKDIRELQEFYEKYENNFLETAIDDLYAQYLRANQQPSGMMSYNEVVAMLIAYYKKTGKV